MFSPLQPSKTMRTTKLSITSKRFANTLHLRVFFMTLTINVYHKRPFFIYSKAKFKADRTGCIQK